MQGARPCGLLVDIACCPAAIVPPFNACFALLENLNEFNPGGVVVHCSLCHVRWGLPI